MFTSVRVLCAGIEVCKTCTGVRVDTVYTAPANETAVHLQKTARRITIAFYASTYIFLFRRFPVTMHGDVLLRYNNRFWREYSRGPGTAASSRGSDNIITARCLQYTVPLSNQASDSQCCVVREENIFFAICPRVQNTDNTIPVFVNTMLPRRDSQISPSEIYNSIEKSPSLIT